MNVSRNWLFASLLALAVGSALAQAPSAPGASAAGVSASGTGPVGMGQGKGGGGGTGGGRGMAARAGADNTPGWSLMSRQERLEHRNRMRAMNTEDECRVYQGQHHGQMATRAKEKGITALPGPRRDPCAGLPK